MRLTGLGLFALAGGLAALTACGGGGVTTTPVAPVGTAAAAVLPDAIATACAHPSTQAQSVALPAAGGVTGTLALGAFAQMAQTCLTLTVATGNDATLTASSAATATARTAQAVTVTAKPVLQMSIDNAFTQNTVVTGATLNAGPLVFPDGTYYAVVTSGTGTTGLTFTAQNGVLTLTSMGTITTVVPGSTAVISIYGRGVIPVFSEVSPAPSPAASSSSAAPSPGASVTPTAAPTALPTVAATATPVASGSAPASPAYGAQIGSYVATGFYDGGDHAGQAANYTQPVHFHPNGPTVEVNAYFAGTIVLTLTGYYPGYNEVYRTDQAFTGSPTCPAGFVTQTGTTGNIYTLTFPANGQAAYLPAGGGINDCAIYVGPVIPGQSQYYDQLMLIGQYTNGFLQF